MDSKCRLQELKQRYYRSFICRFFLLTFCYLISDMTQEINRCMKVISSTKYLVNWLTTDRVNV